MLNVENDPSAQGKQFSPPGREYPVPVQLNTLKPEEIKMLRDCTFSMYYKVGLPFAVFCQVVSTLFKKPDQQAIPTNYFKKGFMFFGNVLVGALLSSPWCHYKLAVMRAELEKKKREEQGMFPDFEESQQFQPAPETDEFTYPVDTISTIGESGGSYSSDFDSSSLLIQEEKNTKIRTTTYDELRALHRSRHAQTPVPSSTQNFEPGSNPSSYSSPVDRPSSSEKSPNAPPPKRVVRNKYGDEIE